MGDIITVLNNMIFWFNQFWDFLNGWTIYGSFSMLDLIISFAVAVFILRVTLWYVNIDDGGEE